MTKRKKSAEVLRRQEGEELVEVNLEHAWFVDDGVLVEITYDDSGAVVRFSASTTTDGGVLTGKPVTSKTLRYPLRKHVYAHAASMHRHPAYGAPAWLGEIGKTQTRRGTTKPDLEYARVAKVYVDNLGTPNALERVVEAFPYLSYGTARNYVRTARDRELLTRTVRGKQGGTLTGKAKQILEESGDDR